MSSNEQAYSFVLLLEGVDEVTPNIEDALAAAGCTDALLGKRNGRVYLDFDRSASSAEDAVLSAIRDAESAGIGARVLRVEPDDIVSQAEIARRAQLSREAVRLLIEGQRGSADFPRPYSGISSRSLLWRWVDVAQWLCKHKRIQDERIVLMAEAVTQINGTLDLRRNKAAYLKELTRLPAHRPRDRKVPNEKLRRKKSQHSSRASISALRVNLHPGQERARRGYSSRQRLLARAHRRPV